MPTDQHHRSKKVRYDLFLVPRDDASQSKSLRFVPWQVYSIVGGAVVLIIGIVIVLLAYTPVGVLIPIQNPELENKYGKELIALNERMSSMMEQLIALREYNVKLRNALGEHVATTDSGVAVLESPRKESPERKKQDQQQVEMNITEASRPLSRTMISQGEEGRQNATASAHVVFPVIMPTTGYITRGFTPDQRHYGLDLAGKTGTLINAAADGYVVFAGWTSDDGYKIILSHAGGFLTFYKHNQSLLTAANAYVRRGEAIALLGNSGQTSAAPHLHFEIWKDGTPVDPAHYILNLNF